MILSDFLSRQMDGDSDSNDIIPYPSTCIRLYMRDIKSRQKKGI